MMNSVVCKMQSARPPSGSLALLLKCGLCLLLVQACQEEAVKPSAEDSSGEEMVTEWRDWKSVLHRCQSEAVFLDMGTLSRDQGFFYGTKCIPPRVFRFNEENELDSCILDRENHNVHWGYSGFLYPSHDGERFFLLSRFIKVPRKMSESKDLSASGRMSVLSRDGLRLLRQKDFPSVYNSYYANHMFAFDENAVYLNYSEIGETFKVDLTEESLVMRPVPSLRGYGIEYVFTYRGIMYALCTKFKEDQNGFLHIVLDDKVLVEFNPANGSSTAYYLGKLLRVIGRQDDLIYLANKRGQMGIYSVLEHAYVVGPLQVGVEYEIMKNNEPVKMWESFLYRMAFDRESRTIYMSFNKSSQRKWIYHLPLDSLTNAQRLGESAVCLKPCATLDVITAIDGSGKVRLHLDPYQHRLFAFYYQMRGKMEGKGGIVDIYNLDSCAADGSLYLEKRHVLGRLLSEGEAENQDAYFMPSY